MKNKILFVFFFSKCQLPYNIACLDITPLNLQEDRTNFCVIGLWTQISVWICRLPTLDILHKEPLTSGELIQFFIF
jgi:DNA damage-binding protein 1